MSKDDIQGCLSACQVADYSLDIYQLFSWATWATCLLAWATCLFGWAIWLFGWAGCVYTSSFFVPSQIDMSLGVFNLFHMISDCIQFWLGNIIFNHLVKQWPYTTLVSEINS